MINCKSALSLVSCSLILLLVLNLPSMGAELALPRIFSTGMVLQREMPCPVWGWATPGHRVSVTFAGQTRSAEADTDGRWQVTLEPLIASIEPRPMTIEGNDQRLTINDVLVGEVWFTAGQSNMMFGIGGATGGAAFHAANAERLRGRVRIVNQLGPAMQAESPQKDVIASWGDLQPGYSAVSYWFAARLFDHFGGKVPIGMITYCAITGAEAWVDRPTLEADPRLASLLTDALDFDAKCYNGVIAPLAPYAIRGAIYYQAEYNGFGDRAIQFRTLFPTMIESWRRAWKRPDLPLLFVQLPGFIATEAPPSEIDMDPATLARYRSFGERRTWTEVRDAQLMTWQAVPHTGMAVAIDVGEPYDIHPPNKEPVADRLFRLARYVAYGEELVHSGPVPVGTRKDGANLEISYAHVGSGLVVQGGELKGFEIAGVEVRFHPAEARIVGDRIVLRSNEVEAPHHWRYAWDGMPEATLYNAEGLPATPYFWIDWTHARQPAESGFTWPNPSFEVLNREGLPIGWRLGPSTSVTDQRAAEGSRAIVMTEPDKSGLFITGVTTGAGAYWNPSPLASAAVRPGCLVSFSFSMAVAPGDAQQELYINLCQDASGSGYQAWDALRTATTASSDFVSRTVVQRLADNIQPSHLAHVNGVGARFIFRGGATPGRLYVDALSPVRIVRPLLEVEGTEGLAFGTVAVAEARDSAPLVIRNGQPHTLRQVLADEDAGTDVATILYGTASFQLDGMGDLQKVITQTDHVGALLIGPDAERFAFISDNLGATARELRLVGADGNGGLTGGPEPEEERFRVRFLGAARPGDYHATLRIVTQAGNRGTLSQGQLGEPPVHFYYEDVSVRITVNNE